MYKIKAIIIEDEPKSQEALATMLKVHCQTVELLGIFNTVKTAVDFIKGHEIELIFLDIELPGDSGFSLFNYNINSYIKIIFTTAYNQYAVQAFKISAVDYLLKPLDVQELKDAVGKVIKMDSNHKMNEAYRILVENLNQGNNRLAISHQNGYDMVETNDILWLEAEINYTTIHMKSKRNVTVAKTLRIFEDSLDPHRFFRISRGAIVNIDHIVRLNKNNTLSITLTDNSTIPVSEARKEDFLTLYKRI